METASWRVDPADVVVSCVFESHPPYDSEAVLLYRTLDALGGAMATARRRAFCAGPVETDTLAALERLSVEVVEVESLIPEYPHANKIRMFEPKGDERLIVALDTDICIASDFSPWLGVDAVAAKPVDQNPLDDRQWSRLFDYFGLSVPRARHLTHFEAAPVTSYFNTGVVLMPTALAGAMISTWEEYTRELWDNYDNLGWDIVERRFFSDQFGFALTLEALSIPTRALPLEMNFPTHQPIAPLFVPDRVNPALVHHHHEVEGGRLRLTEHEGPNEAIERINQALDRQGWNEDGSHRTARRWQWRSRRRDTGTVTRR